MPSAPEGSFTTPGSRAHGRCKDSWAAGEKNIKKVTLAGKKESTDAGKQSAVADGPEVLRMGHCRG